MYSNIKWTQKRNQTLLEWNEYLFSADYGDVIRVWNKNGICLQEVKENGGSRLIKWKGKLVCGSYGDTNHIWKYGLELWNTGKFI